MKGLAVRFFAALRMTLLLGCIIKCTKVSCFDLGERKIAYAAGWGKLGTFFVKREPCALTGKNDRGIMATVNGCSVTKTTRLAVTLT